MPGRQHARAPNLVPGDVCKESPPLDKFRKPVAFPRLVTWYAIHNRSRSRKAGRELARKYRESSRTPLLQSGVREDRDVVREASASGFGLTETPQLTGVLVIGPAGYCAHFTLFWVLGCSLHTPRCQADVSISTQTSYTLSLAA